MFKGITLEIFNVRITHINVAVLVKMLRNSLRAHFRDSRVGDQEFGSQSSQTDDL